MPYPTAVVEIGFDHGPYVASPTWTDVTSYVRAIEISRGRADETQNFESGTASVVLDSRDRRFDPFYSAGPYYGKLEPRRQIRIRATVSGTTYDIFRGYIEGWPVELTDANYDSTVTLSCFDALGLLAEEELPDDLVAHYISSTNPKHFWPLDDPINLTTPESSTLRDIGSLPSPITPVATQRVANADGLAAGITNTSFLLADSRNILVNSPVRPRPANEYIYASVWRTIPDPNVTTLILEVSAYLTGQVSYDLTTNTVDIDLFDGTTVYTYRNTATYLDATVPHHFFLIMQLLASQQPTLYIDNQVCLMTPVSSAALPLTMQDSVALFPGKTQQLAVWWLLSGTFPNPSTIYNLSRSQIIESTAARFTRLISYTSFPNSLTSAPATVYGQVAEITNGGPPVVSELQLLADSEGGNLYVSKNGTLTLTSRYAIFEGRSATSQATFGTGGISIGPAARYHYDAETIRNQLAIGFTGEGSIEIEDTSSISTYGVRGGSWSTQLSTVDDAENLGDILIGHYKLPKVTLEPYNVNVAAVSADWQTVLSLELLDRVTVTIPQRIGSDLTIKQILQRIEWTITPGQWSCRLTGSNRFANVFILNTSTLNGTDVLA